tara:strand:+ start:49833 stop:51779 length:1947 start_codon:yes stop_codon:yes gene_type:complete
MSKLLKAVIVLIIFLSPFSQVFATDIPIIVIAPSQKAQSKSTVGTSVSVYDENTINQSNDYFLGDVLGDGTTSFNYFQTGGHGSSSGIQLRGLPKRYSTVYIDGVRQSDPSSVSGDFDFSHILKSQISRVEVLKGNQSSVYGSGAMGGTINITTKKGKPGFQRDINYNTGSHGTHNLALSLSGADQKNDFFVGIERFITDGISAMDNNDESDSHENDTLTANYGYKFTDKVKLENNLRLTNGFKEYDTEADVSAAPKQDDEEQIQSEMSFNTSLLFEPNQKFSNRLTYSKYNIKRTYNRYTDVQDDYKGDRKSLTYFGNYNFDLDSSVVFGLDTAFDTMNYKIDSTFTKYNKEGATTNSAYVDYQKRFTNNIYATVGGRIDDHSVVGEENSYRTTLAYLFDDKATKIKSSYGKAFRFPSLYELYYVSGAHPKVRENMKAETSKGFDIGFEKSFSDLGLNIDLTYFNIKYFDAIEGWAGNTEYYVWGNTRNNDSTTKAQGVEFLSKWKTNKDLNFDLNYTYTSTYDGAEHDNPDLLSSYTNSQMVRVPRHFLNFATNYTFPDTKLNLSLKTKISSKARDYGNANEPANGTFDDVKLNSYMVNDLSLNYKLWGTYNVFFDVINVFDKKYNTALQYSQMDRSFNFGIKRSY